MSPAQAQDEGAGGYSLTEWRAALLAALDAVAVQTRRSGDWLLSIQVGPMASPLEFVGGRPDHPMEAMICVGRYGDSRRAEIERGHTAHGPVSVARHVFPVPGGEGADSSPALVCEHMLVAEAWRMVLGDVHAWPFCYRVNVSAMPDLERPTVTAWCTPDVLRHYSMADYGAAGVGRHWRLVIPGDDDAWDVALCTVTRDGAALEVMP